MRRKKDVPRQGGQDGNAREIPFFVFSFEIHSPPIETGAGGLYAFP
jgi:hypothetical protein